MWVGLLITTAGQMCVLVSVCAHTSVGLSTVSRCTDPVPYVVVLPASNTLCYSLDSFGHNYVL